MDWRHLASCLLVAGFGSASAGCSEAIPPEDEPEEIVEEGGGCAPGDRIDGDACLAPGMENCPEGFDAVDGGCVPVLPAEPCPDGTMALPGDTFCHEPMACGAGPWGDIPLEAGAQHVDAAFFGTSDGTAGKPWRTIQQAIDAAAPGGQIAVAAGVYDEGLVISGKPVRIWGTCPTQVYVGRAGVTGILIEDGAHQTEIHGLSVTGAFGVANGGSRDVALDGVWIHDTSSRGLLSESAVGEASTIVRRSLIERATELGAFAFGAGLTVEDSVIRNTVPGGGSGRGISVRGSSTLTVAGSVIAGNTDLGVLVSGSSGHLERTVISDTFANAGLGGGGLAFQPDSSSLLPASGTVDGVVLERNATYGVLVHGSSASLYRLSVRDTYAQPLDGSAGAGVQIQADDVTGTMAEVVIDQLLSERNHYAGLSVTGAHIDASRALLRDLYPEPSSGEYGRGVVAFLDPVTGIGVTGSFRGVRIERAVEAGFFAQGVDLVLEDVAVSHTFPRPDGRIGRGICFQSEDRQVGSRAELRRVWLETNHDAGLLLEGTTATVEGITVIGTQATVAEGDFGDAIQVLTDAGFPVATATIEGAHVEGSHRAGITAYGADVTLRGSTLQCNPIDLNGQDIGGRPFSFSDEGDNRCFCGDEEKTCRVLTTDLRPPSPLR